MKLQNPTSPSPFRSILFLHVMLLHSLSLLQPNYSTNASALGNHTDRFALLKFKESIFNDPHGILNTWNDSIHFCNWPGIACSRRHQRTTTLNLSDYDLRGTISPYVGNLSFMRALDLTNNYFFRGIPEQVGRLFRLQYLYLYNNMLEGKLPVNLSYCSKLRAISIGKNRLIGLIPHELGSLMKLRFLNLQFNNLTGGIPPSLGNISSLEIFSVAYNNLFGSVPNELGKLKSLITFVIGPNSFSGTIPLSIFNISSLVVFSIPYNQFKGTIPSTIGLTLPNLQNFEAAVNGFSGVIPQSFSNASHLQVLDIFGNKLAGHVPESLGGLQELQWLNLGNNSLGSYLPNSLNFIASLTNCSQLNILNLAENNFRGVLPNSISNFSAKLSRLYLGGNQISGSIPSALENLANLIILGLEVNLFTGVIPTSLGRLKDLQVLALHTNILTGKIPPSIGNLTQLFELDLSHNKVEGSIPNKIAACHSLQNLDISNNILVGEIPKEIFLLSSLSISLNLSQNSLTGYLPVEVSKLKNIKTIDLSENNLTGKIPETIGDCQVLESLYLQGNCFQETLPSTLGSLKGVQYMDFSRNSLTGQIPKDLQNLQSLLYLNLSFNNLEGEVPNEGVFENISVVSLVGNTKLCGGVSELHLQACPRKKSEKRESNRLKLTIIIVLVVALFLLFTSCIILHLRRSSQRKTNVEVPKLNDLPKISYKKLFQATNGFSPSMLIGIGSFGSVYRGILDPEENPIAVKVLNLQQKGAGKSFVAECNALRSVRHRNLVKILTCCSSIDYNGNEFKALVFEYMSNGSLEKWLHLVTDDENRSTGLNLLQRLNIAIDVALAIQYLHDDCDQPIIHCDLKPSNVLLDNEMVAHATDFGLARLISNTTSFSNAQTSTTGMKGTIGYVAREYAMGGGPSREGDVYSYGILVLEMFTGKRPTDEMFKDDFNLHNFVRTALPERLVEIVDSSLLPREAEQNALMIRELDARKNINNMGDVEIEIEEGFGNHISAYLRNCLVSVLEIGISCSKESPNERMNMGDVIRELQHIRNAYISFENRGQR
ncbi:probable LRR receptor-like serine/threonine-protein kinase At3g47570 [Morus notabilis]|uniref:probable LRR receptor-like serine/threonine-protein kinase At3g47570 n=1 Tax=Morus notabilis TaxID=981085 RepID=UPI000CED6DD8|nr:probable LRR receptor-like serine/threonine-protein kinase At3g47570 [Morus notabilis]